MLFIVFCIATACYVINKDGASCSVILEDATKTNKIKTSLFKPIELLIALKDISNTKSGQILRILVIMIE